jgi:CRISPR-associated protein Cas5d
MKGFCLEVNGPYACFTRPEMKVERVSYDVITPSAARAVYDAILWKPAIRWRVTRIEVLSPIRWISVRRNEVGAAASTKKRHIFIEDKRQQKAGLFLRDVKYRLFAKFEFIPPEKRSKVYNPVPEYLHDMEELEIVRQDEKPAKYAAMFERRARKGQCFNQPYLGCREFSAQVRIVYPKTEPATPISETRDLGWMLYDMDYSDPNNIKPQFFRAELNCGVLDLDNVEVHS